MKGKNLRAVQVDPDAPNTVGDDLVLPDEAPEVSAPQPNQAQSSPSRADDLELPDQPSKLEGVYKSVADANPDHAAKVIGIAQKIGEPEPFVASNLPAIEKAAASPPTSLFAQLEQKYPGTTKFLSDPRKMAITHDDIPNVQQHEDAVQTLNNTYTVDNLWKTFYGGAEESSLGLMFRQKLPENKAPENADTVHRLLRLSGMALGDIPIGTVGAAFGAGVGGSVGTLGGAALGTAAAGPVGTIAGGGVGGVAGAIAGGGAGALGLPAFVRQALEEDIQKGNIKGIGDVFDRFRGALSEAYKQGLPGAAGALAGGGAGVAASKVASPIIKTLAPLAAEWAGFTGANAAVEGRAPTKQEALDNLVFMAGLHYSTHLASGVVGAAQDVAPHIADAYERAKADQVLNAYGEIGDAATASKLRGRMPDAHGELIDQLTKDTPAENVYVPVEALNTYFQSKNIDPAAAMEEMGAGKAYAEAKETGGDVQVPFANWVRKLAGTEHYAGLAEDIKFDPDSLTAREARVKLEEKQASFKQTSDDIQAQQEEQANAQAQAEAQAAQTERAAKVREAVTAQLESAGVSREEIEHAAQIHQQVFSRLAEAFGVDPEELQKQYPLTVNGPESERAPATEGAAQKGFNQEAALDMTKAARLERAKELGFDTSKVWYHGTPYGRLEEFDPHMSPRDIRVAGFFTQDKEFARPFARGDESGLSADVEPSPFIHKVHLKTENAFDYDKSEHVESVMRQLSNADIKKIAKQARFLNDKPMTRKDIKQQVGLGNWMMLEDPTVFEAVKKAGFDAMHVHEKGVKNIAVFEPHQIRSINAAFDPEEAASGKIYYQSGSEDNRGRIRFGSKNQFSIDLFEKADKSTFLHESGHYFLEIMGDLASKEDAPQSIKDDYATLLKWFGVDSKDQIGSEQHEKFARGFESYLMEGKAPTEKLQATFDKFRTWLTEIYKHLKNLNVNLTDDVRGVMDRMLASQEEIEAAKRRQLISDEKIEGAPPEAEAKIKVLQDKAREMAESTLMKEQMKELDEKHKEFLSSERERQLEKAKEDVGNEPVFKAGASLEGDPNFAHFKDAADIADKFLRENLDPELSAKVEVQAELNGFASGEEMAQQIILAKETKAYDVEVNKRVEAAMAPYADLRNTSAIRAEAMKAIHNEKMTELLALEHEILSDLVHKKGVQEQVTKRKRLEARLEASAARDQARQILSDKPIKDAGNPKAYITAERNAAVKVAKALARGDHEAAAEAKRQQMLNHALASEAMKNASEIEKTIASIGKFDGGGHGLNKAPRGFSRQVEQLMSRFDLAEPRAEDAETQIAVAKDMEQKGSDANEIANATGYRLDPSGKWVPETLSDFITRVNDNYYGLHIPDSVMGGSAKSYKELTLSDLRDLSSAVNSIADIGKKYSRFLSDFLKLEVKDAAAQLKASVLEKVGTPYADKLKIGSTSKSKFEDAIQSLKDLPGAFSRSLDNMLTLAEKLDGGHDGPVHEYIYRPLKMAEDRKMARMQEVMKEVDGIFAKHYDEKEFASYKDQRFSFDVGTQASQLLASDSFGHGPSDTNEARPQGRILNKEEILSMALNWGNEGNRDRIMRGYKLDVGQVEQILQKLSKKDWDFVQDVWHHLDSYWPEIAALETKVRGIAPKKVPNAPVTTPHGTYEGGYYPIAYDFDKSADAYQNAQEKNALYKQYSAAAAHTDTGHTQERVSKVSRPIRLSLDVFRNHIENVVHDLEYRPAVIDVNRLLNERDTKSAMVNAIGVKGYSVVGDWLKAAASDQGEQLSIGDHACRWFRFKATMFNLGFRIVSVPKIALENMFNVSSEIGMSGTARAIQNYYFGESGMHEMVAEKSVFMRQRAEHLNRDLADITNKWRGTGLSGFHKFAFFTHAITDQGMSFPLWADSYKRSLAEFGDETKAVNLADETVKRTFMSGTALDQSAAMRGTQAQKLVTMAFSYQSMMWNRFSQQMSQVDAQWVRGNKGAAVAIAARAGVYTFLLPAMTAALTRELLRNNQSTDEDESQKRVAAAILEEGTPLKFVPVLRDLAPYLIKKAQGENGGHFQLSPLEEAAQTLLNPTGEFLHSVFSDDHHLGDKFPEQAVNAASLLTGVPKQVNDVVFNFLDWQQGNGEATWRDFLSRRTKK